jgi:hypothetical protein
MFFQKIGPGSLSVIMTYFLQEVVRTIQGNLARDRNVVGDLNIVLSALVNMHKSTGSYLLDIVFEASSKHLKIGTGVRLSQHIKHSHT